MLTRKLPGFEPGSSISRLSQQTAAQLKRVPLPWWQAAVVLLLLLVLANSSARLLWTLLPESETADARAPVINMQRSTSTSRVAAVDIGSLTALNLFGKVGETAALLVDIPPPQDDIDAEETKLSLKLTSTTVSSVPSASRAMIAHNKNQKSYAPGAKLPGGRQVTLDRVLDQKVIINNAGRYESLTLYEKKSEPSSGTNRNIPSTNRRVPKPVASTPPPSRNTSNRAKAAAPRQQQPTKPKPTTEKAPVVSVSKQIITDGSWSKMVSYSMHPKGIQVRPGVQRALFDKAGLKNGDVITHVNGVNIRGNPAQGLSLYQQIQESGSASLQILRNGKTIDLDVEIDN